MDFSSYVPKEGNEMADMICTEMLKTGNFNKLFAIKSLKNRGIKTHSCRDIALYHSYLKMVIDGKIQRNKEFETAVRTKNVRGNSGVLVFTILMSDKPNGQNFTCKNDCHYCPKYPGIARSYIPTEPAVARGLQHGWNVKDQIRDRFFSYIATGQYPYLDGKVAFKADVIIEGGTYNHYPIEYREQFFRELYHAFNTLFDSEVREFLPLEKEMKINENGICGRVVGLSVETRPDQVNDKLLEELRRFGVTKCQLGVQHLDDDILKFVNRGCYTRHTKNALKKLLDSGFKVQIHIMPDLPGSSVKKDKAMFDELFSNREFYFDHLKIYPCSVTPHTEIAKWYDNAKELYKEDEKVITLSEENSAISFDREKRVYFPYSDSSFQGNPEKLYDVLEHAQSCLKKNKMHHVRIERTVRDIPISDIIGGCDQVDAGSQMQLRHPGCVCIRCREIQDKPVKSEPELVVRATRVVGAIEYFLSFESEGYILGFLRLRIPTEKPDSPFAEITRRTGVIRELHVYGRASMIGSSSGNVQHKGLGKRLCAVAEHIARDNGCTELTVISGNGVKPYYANLDFVDMEYYMNKTGIKRIPDFKYEVEWY